MKAAEAKERLEVAATGTKAAQKIEAGGAAGERGTRAVADVAAVKALIKDWPPMSVKAAEQTLDKYGPPNEATASRLIWFDNGPWKRTICYRDGEF